MTTAAFNRRQSAEAAEISEQALDPNRHVQGLRLAMGVLAQLLRAPVPAWSVLILTAGVLVLSMLLLAA